MTDEPRKNLPAISAGNKPLAIVPQDFDSCYRIAQAVCAAQMAPAGMDTPEKAMIAIMHGLEIGLPPMAALQRIAVVNGRPSIWGDAAIGLVRASGLSESIKEWIEGEGDARTAYCEAKRRGEPNPSIGKFSVADAKLAGLWSPEARVTRYKKDGGSYQKDNDSPWHRYPDRMLKMRARGFSLRDGFADVLGGLYLREELEAGPAQENPPRQNLRGEADGSDLPDPATEAKTVEAIVEKAPAPDPASEAKRIGDETRAEVAAKVASLAQSPPEQIISGFHAGQSADMPPPSGGPYMTVAIDGDIPDPDAPARPSLQSPRQDGEPPLIAKYRAAVELATTPEALDAAWNDIIGPHMQSLTKELYELTQAIDDKRRGEIE